MSTFCHPQLGYRLSVIGIILVSEPLVVLYLFVDFGYCLVAHGAAVYDLDRPWWSRAWLIGHVSKFHVGDDEGK